MPYEDKKAAPQRRPHAVTLDERSHLTVTGVDEVVRFDDTEVSMRTSRGMLTVHGEGLRVGRLAIDTGELAIDGAFDALDYTEETASGGGACGWDAALDQRADHALGADRPARTLGLIDFAEAPFHYTLLAPRKCALYQSPLLGALRALTA